MSIFKDSFPPVIQDQISLRQKALTNRTSKNLTYYNSRNAWIRLSSSVNIYRGSGSIDDENNYTNDLAKKYILQGGILNESISGEGQLREGIGDFSKAYSTNTSDGRFYRLGIRPMPGITGVDIKSKGAYGSLREATINFQCWDIKQLEDLELLYMRPGYSLLLEWGWSPYLDNKGELNTTVQYGDIINSKPTKEVLFKQQYAKSTDGKYKEDGKEVQIKGYEGNYDSMYGFIKNYSWKARPDGGYDCQTSIISMGEIIESLKVNYSPFDNVNEITSKGLLSPNLQLPDNIVPDTTKMNLSSSYSQNVLAGLFEEMYKATRQISAEETDKGFHFTLYDKKYKNYYDVFHKTINVRSSAGDQTGGEDIGKNDEQVYITLEGLTRLINNYVLLEDQKAGLPFVGLSVFENDSTDVDPITGKGYLLSLAHPLQLSIDPTICLIKNKLWTGGIKFDVQPNANEPNVNEATGSTVVRYGLGNYDPETGDGKKWWEELTKRIIAADGSSDQKITDELITYVQKTIGSEPNTAIEELKEIQRNFLRIKKSEISFNPITSKPSRGNKEGKKVSEYSSFYDLLDEGGSSLDVQKALYLDILIKEANPSKTPFISKISEAAKNDPATIVAKQVEEIKKDLDEKQESLENLAFLNNIKRPYFIDDGDYKKELGIIGNIYVNLGMLYNMCTNEDLAAQDTKEKNDIALYDFIKSVLKKISTAIGGVNNFELFIDPNNNLAKIIDINYVDRNDPNTAYKNAFEIQVHNINAIVRSYSLESQIFQDQSTIIAIGAQAGGGALAADTTTLTAYNKRIIDRIIPKKKAPSSPTNTAESKYKELLSALNVLFTFINRLEYNDSKDANFDIDDTSKYNNALKDLINYFKNIGKSKIKNKAIIPTKLNITMDGIGGIIIGNIFKIPDEILPRGYKGGDVGARLGYIVTEMGHSINNNDWQTNLVAQTIILEEDTTGIDIDYENITIELPVYREETPPAESGSGAAETKGTDESKPPTPSGTGNGCKAIAPDVSSIRDSELDIVKGPFSTNTGTVNELAVVDGKPVGKDVAKAIILMKRAAAKDGVDLRVNSGFRSPYTTIGPNGPIKSTKGTTVSSTSQDSLYAAYLKNKKPLTAKPGSSNHGNAFAFDLNTGSVTGTIKSPLNKKVYQWLIDNAHKYGFVRWVAKEEWHWEYRPGEYQFNQRVPRDNKLYAGMKTDSPCN